MIWIPSDTIGFNAKQRQTECWVAGVYQGEIWKAVAKWISHGCSRPLVPALALIQVHIGRGVSYLVQIHGFALKPLGSSLRQSSFSHLPSPLPHFSCSQPLPVFQNISCVCFVIYLLDFFFFNCNWGLGTGNISLYPSGMNSPSFEVLVLQQII